MARAVRLAPPLGQWRTFPEGLLHFTDQGSGSAIVLIHGLGGNLRNFSPELVDHLTRNHRVIALDRPGAGYSIAKGAVPDLHGQAAMIAALIEALDQALRDGVRQVERFALSQACAVAVFDDVSAFVNVNTLQELAALHHG